MEVILNRWIHWWIYKEGGIRQMAENKIRQHFHKSPKSIQFYFKRKRQDELILKLLSIKQIN